MNSQTDQVTALKKAILERAHKLAKEHVAQGNAARQSIMQDAREKIQLMEQKELLAAKAAAERDYLRKVQASEIHLQAEMDRNRWGLVQIVMDRLNERLQKIRNDADENLAILTQLLQQAAGFIDQQNMVASLNAADRELLEPKWQQLASDSGYASLQLDEKPIECSGGIRLVSADGNIRVDNTFEGLIARNKKALQNTIYERLFASVTGTGVRSHG